VPAQLGDEGMSPRMPLKTISSGRCFVVFCSEGEDDLLIAARQGSPPAIGHGNGEKFCHSDAIAPP
jgi:glucosamine--fructose-6-phosphate aminotransferase (isomerizing)